VKKQNVYASSSTEAESSRYFVNRLYYFFLASLFVVKKRSSNLPILLGMYEVSHNFRTSLQSSVT